LAAWSTGDVRALLDEIIDPCSIAAGAPAGLVEMGLVRGVEVTSMPAGDAITVRIGLTEPGCMMGASFVVRVREALEPLPGVARVDVELEHDSGWSPCGPRRGLRAKAGGGAGEGALSGRPEEARGGACGLPQWRLRARGPVGA
jgi:metal-sulfur cluster biosynthetic enzyme